MSDEQSSLDLVQTDAIPFIFEGQVVDVSDPDQMGRVRVWCPSIDGESFEIENLPWATYVTPFAGFTVDYPAGSSEQQNETQAAYGMWAVPKVGASVAVFCLNADPNQRCYFGAFYRLHRNRSLPRGRNTDFNGNIGPFGDAGDGDGNLVGISPAFSNMHAQFQGKMKSSETLTRGAWERSVAQGRDDKNGDDGYAKSPVDDYLDPQTYCFTTPGRHSLIFQDHPTCARMRLVTAEGSQAIFDDANERIYISVATGRVWLEMDWDGHFSVYAADSMSFRSGKDMNFYADGKINMQGAGVNISSITEDVSIGAAGDVNVKAFKSVKISGCSGLHLESEADAFLTASSSLNLLSKTAAKLSGTGGVDIAGGPYIKLTAGMISRNGAPAAKASEASCPSKPESPTVVPGAEPWTRPASSITRGKNWKA